VLFLSHPEIIEPDGYARIRGKSSDTTEISLEFSKGKVVATSSRQPDVSMV
jgi:hypothetical protein